jgi:hypothetical protein
MKSSNGFAALEALKNEMETQRRIEHENRVKEAWERRNKLMEKVGFVTPEEMIDYIMRGGRITDREGQYFRLVDGMVEMIYEIYDEGAGPLGFGKKYKTLDEFKDFVYNILVKHREYNGDKWLPTWVKDEYYEF